MVKSGPAWHTTASPWRTLPAHLLHYLGTIGWALLTDRVSAALANITESQLIRRRVRSGEPLRVSRKSLVLVAVAVAAGLVLVGRAVARQKSSARD